MGILQLLARENYITYHKTLAKTVGVDEAILFGELCSMNNLYGDDFFCEQEKLMNDTCLTEYRIRNALKNLQKFNLVSVTKKGLPAKNYYILNENVLIEILDRQSTSAIKFDTTVNDNFDSTCDVKSDSTFNKNTVNKNTRNNNTDTYNTILDYLNQKAGTAYKATSKATQSHIKARLKDGYTVEDFKTVIDKQCAKWKGTEWEQYLRPSTLFGTKFENYLNGKVVKPQNSNDGWCMNDNEGDLPY